MSEIHLHTLDKSVNLDTIRRRFTNNWKKWDLYVHLGTHLWKIYFKSIFLEFWMTRVNFSCSKMFRGGLWLLQNHLPRIGGSLEINLHTLVKSFGYAGRSETIEKEMQSSCPSGIKTIWTISFFTCLSENFHIKRGLPLLDCASGRSLTFTKTSYKYWVKSGDTFTYLG